MFQFRRTHLLAIWQFQRVLGLEEHFWLFPVIGGRHTGVLGLIVPYLYANTFLNLFQPKLPYLWFTFPVKTFKQTYVFYDLYIKKWVDICKLLQLFTTKRFLFVLFALLQYCLQLAPYSRVASVWRSLPVKKCTLEVWLWFSAGSTFSCNFSYSQTGVNSSVTAHLVIVGVLLKGCCSADWGPRVTSAAALQVKQ